MPYLDQDIHDLDGLAQINSYLFTSGEERRAKLERAAVQDSRALDVLLAYRQSNVQTNGSEGLGLRVAEHFCTPWGTKTSASRVRPEVPVVPRSASDDLVIAHGSQDAPLGLVDMLKLHLDAVVASPNTACVAVDRERLDVIDHLT